MQSAGLNVITHAPRPAVSVSGPQAGWGLYGVLALREPALAVHSARSTVIAVALAQEVGFAVLPETFWGFLLHDIGTLDTPASILGKPGPLTNLEHDVVTEHPYRSARLLGEVQGLGEAASVALHHHERWDGAGYPDGLRGERIPFASRLLSLGDAFAAMTASRPYRSERSGAESVETIAAEAGRQFDPTLTAAFQGLAPHLPEALVRGQRRATDDLDVYAARAQHLSRAQLEALFASALGIDSEEAAGRCGRSAGTQRNWTSSLRRTLACPPRLPLSRFFASVGRAAYDSVVAACSDT